MIIRDAIAYLATLDPNLPWAALSLAVFGLIYLVRRYLPSVWLQFSAFAPAIDDSRIRSALRKLWQAIPSVAIGAVIPALASGGDVKLALYGAIAGAVAPFLHEVAAAVPFIPYQGKVGPKPKPLGDDDDTPPDGTKPVGLSTLALAMVLSGCGFGGPNAPDDPCPDAARVALVECPALAAAGCEGKPLAECANRDAIRAECHERLTDALEACE